MYLDLDLRALNADIEATAKRFGLSIIEKFQIDENSGDWGWFIAGDAYCEYFFGMGIRGVTGVNPSIVEPDGLYFDKIYDILIKRFTNAKKFTKYLNTEIKLSDYVLEIEE